MKRIGILGGTFNPIHMGHLTIAEMARERFRLEKVLFIPSFLPPHKTGKDVISAEDRLRMVKMGIAGNPCFEVSDFEIAQRGRSYSVDTLAHLKRDYPKGTRFFFIIGGDLISGLKTWKHSEELFRMTDFIAVYRPGFKNAKTSARIKSIIVPGIHISSSEVRARRRVNKSVKYLVPENVLQYMNKKKLYIIKGKEG